MIPPRLRDNIPLYLSSIFTSPPSTPRSSPVLHFLFDNSLFYWRLFPCYVQKMCFGLASAIIKKMVLIILTNDVAPNIWPLEGRMFPPSNEEEEEQEEEEQGDRQY